MIDELEIRKYMTTLHSEGDVMEVRVIRKCQKSPTVGYFKSMDVLIDALRQQNLEGANVYAVLNEINPACYAKSAHDKFLSGAVSTSDNDIKARRLVLIDLDPKRPTDTSSSEMQVHAAYEKAIKVFEYLKQQGFSKPMVVFSGNGYHLIYKVALRNDEYNKQLIKDFLKTLDLLFSDEEIQIDTANFNAARVCKIAGTIAQKGANTKEYPHRMSKVVSIPEPFEITDKTYFEKVIKSISPEPEKPQEYNNYNSEKFNLDEWLSKYSIGYRKMGTSDGDKYILDCCPFDSSHTGKDAVLFKRSNGAIGFHCFHNSCQGKTWHDMRILYEPTAYEKKWENQKKIQYGSYNRNKSPRVIPDNPNEPKFLELIDVVHSPEPDYEFVKTGIHEIDRKMQGLIKPSVSVVTGLRGSAKSTVLSEIGLNAVEGGNNVSYFSGELNPKKFTRWMMLQAAGRSRVDVGQFEGTYNVPIRFQELIGKWLYGKLRLRNNYYGNSFSVMIKDFEEEIKKHHTDLLILDNLMALDVSDLAATKWDAQTEFVLKLQELAKQYNVAVVFVAHPRKAMGLLRFDDIAGTADLGNAVDNAFIVHRINEDFRRLSKEMFKWKDDNEIYKATNCIEIVKDREFGTQDVFVPLWYEEKTKRLKNEPAENVIYGWDVGNIPVPDETPDARANYSTVEDPVFD